MWRFNIFFTFIILFTCCENFSHKYAESVSSLELTDNEADMRRNRVMPSPNSTEKCVYIAECGYPGLRPKNGHEIHRKIDRITGLPIGYSIVGVPERKTWKHIVLLTKILGSEIVVFNKKVKKTFYIGKTLSKVNGVIKCYCTEIDKLGEIIWIQNIRPADPDSETIQIAAVDNTTGKVYHMVSPDDNTSGTDANLNEYPTSEHIVMLYFTK